MPLLLRIARAIDALNRRVGRTTVWFILVSVLISAGNAVMRKAFDLSSNAWLEAQWYLYGAAYLLAAGYVLMVDEHVRIDAVSQRLTKRQRAWIDVAALLLFALPLCAVMVDLGGAYFWQAYVSGERSYNADGLVRWPIYLCIPLGFGLLGLQVISELIKRFAFLRGHLERAHLEESDLPEFMGRAPGRGARS
jgi:TRAP-type mannitol/chloroaromatic compound transport system permease small subunit